MIRCAGLMAGGRGSRLLAGGVNVPKPLFHVNGRPLVTYFLDQAAEIGIEHIVAAIRVGDTVLQEVLKADNRFEWSFAETTGSGTLEAVTVLTTAFGSEEHLISTCDVILPPGSLARFVDAIERNRQRRPVAVLLSSDLVHDPIPIWLKTDPADRAQVVDVGKDIWPTGSTFGHVRWASGELDFLLRQVLPLDGLRQDTKMLSLLARSPKTLVLHHLQSGVIDVDDIDDARFAERLIQGGFVVREASVEGS